MESGNFLQSNSLSAINAIYDVDFSVPKNPLVLQSLSTFKNFPRIQFILLDNVN